MPDERYEGQPTSDDPNPDDYVAVDDTTEESGGEEESIMLPKHRYDEAAQQREEARIEAAQAKGEADQLRQQLQQYQAAYAQQQQAVQTEARQAQSDQGDSDKDKRQRAIFAQDEVGQATFEALREFQRIEQEDQGGGVTEEQVRQIAQQYAGSVYERIESATSTTSALQNYVAGGVFSADDAGKIQRAYQERLQDPRQAAAARNPANANYILKDIVHDMMMRKDVTPHPPMPRNRSPMAVTGNGMPMAGPRDSGDRKSSPFVGLRGLDSGKVLELQKMSEDNYGKAH